MRNRYRTWTVFAIALCCLLALMLVPSIAALRRSEQVYREVQTIQENHERSQRLLEGLARSMFLISITIREFLLDSSTESDRMYVKRLSAARNELSHDVAELRTLIHAQELPALQRLEEELDAYWNSIVPVFRWTPRQRLERGTYFLRQEQRPTRQSVLDIAAEIRRLNTSSYRQQDARVTISQEEYRRYLNRVLGLVFVIGLVVTAASILRIRQLESRAQRQHEEVERTGQELRNLSVRLRHAQEEERKQISRELHDEVGQKLTALRMELGSIEDSSRVAEMKTLTEQSLRMIRDIAAGLRPSMLDDLGLAPAIQRHAREFARRTGTPVSVRVGGEGQLERLPDRHRTYIYRILQESLTNCAKHAQASRIEVSLNGDTGAVQLNIRDDGVGFDPARSAHAGLGLIGIEERVRELGGSFRIESAPGKGTSLTVTVPRNGNGNG